MLRNWRERRLAKAVAGMSWCDGSDGVCTAECRSDGRRERVRDSVLSYPMPGML